MVLRKRALFASSSAGEMPKTHTRASSGRFSMAVWGMVYTPVRELCTPDRTIQAISGREKIGPRSAAPGHGRRSARHRLRRRHVLAGRGRQHGRVSPPRVSARRSLGPGADRGRRGDPQSDHRLLRHHELNPQTDVARRPRRHREDDVAHRLRRRPPHRLRELPRAQTLRPPRARASRDDRREGGGAAGVGIGYGVMQLTERDNGAEITVHRTEEIIIALPENPTTGYRWAVEATGDALALTSADYAPAATAV